MIKRWRIVVFWALAAIVGLWIRWWGSSGFPLEGEICETANPKYNCESYNVFFYSAWRLAAVANHWSELVTALATVAIAAFTLTLWKSNEKATKLTQRMSVIARRQFLISAQQTDIQRKQHALGRLQFFATQRPRLQIRHVAVVHQGKTIGHPTLFFEHGATVKGGLSVVNMGGSDATILDSRYRIFFSKTGLPVEAPYDTDFRTNLIFSNVVLRVGESCATPIEDKIIMDAPDKNGTRDIRAFDREGWEIYVMGWIRYRDDGGAEQFMGFCRKRQSDGRFRSVQDPDYEWED